MLRVCDCVLYGTEANEQQSSLETLTIHAVTSAGTRRLGRVTGVGAQSSARRPAACAWMSLSIRTANSGTTLLMLRTAGGAAAHAQMHTVHRRARNVKPAMRNVNLPRPTARCQTCNAQWTARHGQRATMSVQRAMCNVQHARCKMQDATCNMQHARCKMQHAWPVRPRVAESL
jgi:hypothetical protein